MHLRKNSARQKTQHFLKTQGQNRKTQLFGSRGPKSFQVHQKKHATETKFWARSKMQWYLYVQDIQDALLEQTVFATCSSDRSGKIQFLRSIYS